ncbi:MAG: hypothetical protein E7536_02590 [Ruminococcaceae bacterium]|nr:hypothetical protein [Oscillospiraceae bacterium]
MKKVLSVLLAVLICFACSVSAFAENSPTPDKYYTVLADVAVVGSGTATAVPTTVKAGEIIVFTAVAAEGYVFDHWRLDGKFEIVDGTIYDPVIKVELVPDADNKTHGDLGDLADVMGEAHFKPIGGEVTTGEQQTAKPDDGPTAPQTGLFDSQATIVIALVIVGLMAVAFIYKKRTEKTK